MSAPRTVTVHTSDHGPVTITCPDWCVGHDEQPAPARAVVRHTGPVIPYTIPTGQGPAETLVTFLEQRPFLPEPVHGTDVFVNVEVAAQGHPSGPRELDRMADALVEHAARLRHAARCLAALRGDDR
ncbi:DUF6907 domain-containing protein [Streptomyces wuyuanensis]|uniref:DUF6907 domain-containing protein n=1 Tax=Streptomyces wuyuanensis TaxID=1196353 RepID=UPI00342ED01E